MRVRRTGWLAGVLVAGASFACGARTSVELPFDFTATAASGGSGAATTGIGGTASTRGGASSGGTSSTGGVLGSAGSSIGGSSAQGGVTSAGTGPSGEGGAGACASGCGGGSVCENGICLCLHGQHSCSGICVDNDSNDHCGAACTACTAPSNGQALPCDGNACNYTCDAGFTDCTGSCLDLTSDSHNCGRCGHDCLGGTCDTGTCQPFPLVEDQPNPLYLAVDAETLYFTTPSGGVLDVPLSGGAPKLLFADPDAHGLTIDDQFVYWTTYFSGTIKRMPLAGGTPVTLVTTDQRPLGVAVDSTWLYYSTVHGAIVRVPLAGGAGVTLYSDTNTLVSGLAVTKSDLFFGTATMLGDFPLPAGMTLTLASSRNNVFGVAFDALDTDTVYFTEQYGGTVSEVSRATGQVTRLVGGLSTYAAGVAVDARAIYWAASNANNIGTIYRLAR